MKWVTRERMCADRIACYWLVKKFVDAGAEFIFASLDEVMNLAEREGAIPFDVFGRAELDHHEGRCSFESIIKKYALTDPALQELAKIVRAADRAADRNTAPEAAGVVAITKGFRLVYNADNVVAEKQLPVYDALYAYCQSKVR